MIVRVATSNPMKVEATRKAFAKFFRKVRVIAVPVKAAVSARPDSFGEIVRGARERARLAFGECDFSVGIEAGTFRVAAIAPGPFQITFACVFNGAREALGSGPFYELPRRVSAKRKTGIVAVVTRGKVTREGVTRDAVVMALAPFISPDLYK